MVEASTRRGPMKRGESAMPRGDIAGKLGNFQRDEKTTRAPGGWERGEDRCRRGVDLGGTGRSDGRGRSWKPREARPSRNRRSETQDDLAWARIEDKFQSCIGRGWGDARRGAAYRCQGLEKGEKGQQEAEGDPRRMWPALAPAISADRRK